MVLKTAGRPGDEGENIFFNEWDYTVNIVIYHIASHNISIRKIYSHPHLPVAILELHLFTSNISSVHEYALKQEE